MKTLKNSFVLTAIAVLGIVSCNEASLTPELDPEEGKLVTVHFGTENTDPSTKATLTPNEGETAFEAAWENGNEILVSYENGSEATGTVTAKWNGSSFDAELPIYKGIWVYKAAYPVPVSDYVDFGSARTQQGDSYNSKYDIMLGEADAYDANAGKDDSGKDIIFKMTRQTAIAYFHFTSNNNEAITKATLKVEGEGAAIAAETVVLNPTGMDYDNVLSEIVLTTTDQTADDFTLWFNVLPTTFTKMTLTVETATKTFTISNTKGGSYTAGKLYKVKKENIAWTDKPVTPSVSVVNVNNVNAVKVMGNGSYGDYKTAQTITVDGLEYSMINICANTKNGSTGYMMAAKQFIQMKSESSYIFNTKNGVTNIKAWVLPTTTDAISVYQGSTSDNISTLINKPNKTTETVKLISNLDSEVDTQLDIYEYTITDGFFKLAPSATLWLYKLEVTYSNSGSSEPAPDTYTVSCANVTGGTLSADPSKASAGTEVTLTATPNNGYEFKSWEVVDSKGTDIKVVDNKFTMPAANVTVSATFTQKDAGAGIDPVNFSVTCGSSSNITTGYTYTKEKAKADSGFDQDKNSSEGLSLLMTKTNKTALFSTSPTSISITVKVGGGTAKNPLSNSVYAYMVDKDGNNIESTETVVTTKVDTKTGKEYTVSIPNVDSAYGLRITHEKEGGYNVRIYSISFTAE